MALSLNLPDIDLLSLTRYGLWWRTTDTLLDLTAMGLINPRLFNVLGDDHSETFQHAGADGGQHAGGGSLGTPQLNWAADWAPYGVLGQSARSTLRVRWEELLYELQLFLRGDPNGQFFDWVYAHSGTPGSDYKITNFSATSTILSYRDCVGKVSQESWPGTHQPLRLPTVTLSLRSEQPEAYRKLNGTAYTAGAPDPLVVSTEMEYRITSGKKIIFRDDTSNTSFAQLYYDSVAGRAVLEGIGLQVLDVEALS